MIQCILHGSFGTFDLTCYITHLCKFRVCHLLRKFFFFSVNKNDHSIGKFFCCRMVTSVHINFHSISGCTVFFVFSVCSFRLTVFACSKPQIFLCLFFCSETFVYRSRVSHYLFLTVIPCQEHSGFSPLFYRVKFLLCHVASWF